MKLLIGLSHENFSGDILGLHRIISALDQSGYDITVIYYSQPEDFTELIENIYFDVGIFSANIRYLELLSDIVSSVKRTNPNMKCILVYPYAVVPEDLFHSVPETDYIVPGHSEMIISALLHGEDATILENYVWVKGDNNSNKRVYMVNFEGLPLPNRSLEDVSILKYIYIQGSDGCRGKCRYCLTTRDKCTWSGRSPASIANEIQSIYEKFRAFHYVFVDKSFEDGGLERIEGICDLFQNFSIPLTFRCYLRADTFSESDLYLLERMKLSGFSNVMVGIESFCDDDLKFFGKRATAQQNRNFLTQIQSAGIHAQIGTILFHPKTTLASLQTNFLSLIEFNVYSISQYISRLFLYRDTPIYQELCGENPDYDYLNPTHYKFDSPRVAEIFSFVNDYLINAEVHEQGEKIRENIYLFYALDHLLSKKINTEDLRYEIEQCIRDIVVLLKNYFSVLYLDCDIKQAKRLLLDFTEDISIASKKISAITLKTNIKFMRLYKGVYRLY